MKDIHLIKVRNNEKALLKEIQGSINEIFSDFGEEIKKPELIFICTDHEGVHIIPEDEELKAKLFTYLKDKNGRPDLVFKLESIQDSQFYSTGHCVMDQLDNVYPFVRVDKNFISGQPKLIHRGIQIGTYIEEIISECLNVCEERLRDGNGDNSVYYKNIIKNSANKLITKLLNANGLPVKGHEFIEDCNAISTMKYEGSVGKGILILQKKQFVSNKDIRFKKELSLKNYRLARKMLEMSKEGIGLTTDGSYVYGLTKTAKDNLETTLIVEFTNHFEYNILLSGQLILKFKDGFPCPINNEVDKILVVNAIKGVFKELNKNGINRLLEIIKAARKQKHGTMILVSKEAENESKRLSEQSTLLKPREIDVNWIESLTSIDGAIIIDEQCMCYAIGAILDGNASIKDGKKNGKKGNPTRGARYNSAVKYHNEHSDNCIIIVISEDGMIDII
ncbi:diadenylate cyclase [Bacillus thuringiensis]|uniref:diadenylate cyclase n=1 Tax=Bacillus thuringiensis TaxID=1428 RepID=UPI0008AC11B5|nr:diadenylate cyclase [Bacillus thuringiensis]SEJ69524.1 DisA checkpoint controller nucleotide-binding [Bacillus thuringiensis]